MKYKVTLDNFEGPLDLLLYLIRKNEIDIQNIPILVITQQYMEYLDLMKSLNLDIAGEFLVMASTLMYIKSRSLLPDQHEHSEEVGEDPLEELRRQLIEYQRYKDIALSLRKKEILTKDVFTRGLFETKQMTEGEISAEDVSIFDLITAVKNIIERGKYSDAAMEVSIEEISLKDRITEIMEKLRDNSHITFSALLAELPTKLEIITTFIALLELIKIQAIRVFQHTPFGEITIMNIDQEHTEGQGSPDTVDKYA